jgi:signal transduction histidine kinase
VDFPESVPDLHLSAESRRNIFLVVKEALHNVVKHSVASEVVMRLIVSNQVIAVAIEDNGKGFPLNEGTREGIGLHSMKKRAEDIGGTIEFESNQPSGTRVHLRIPMASADDEKRNKS